MVAVPPSNPTKMNMTIDRRSVMKIRALIAIFLSVASIFIVSCDRPNQPEEPVVNEFEGVRVDFSYDLYHSTIHTQMEHGDYLDFVNENKETLLPIKWISYDEIFTSPSVSRVLKLLVIYDAKVAP